ncbi:MAG: protein kinase domain-containing protein [Myxococcota bacterium]
MTHAPPSSAAPAVRCTHCGEDHPRTYAHCPQTGQDLTGATLLGHVIAGKYRLMGELGEGGMGTVYAAENLRVGRKVAIKRLHPELAADENAVRRFHREARAAAATGHEHIVEVLDMGVAEDGAPFLVMEYLQGENLAQLLRRAGRLAPQRACHILGQALEALSAVHGRGIIHRDLKPDNLFLAAHGGEERVKVVDFGVSKVRREAGESFATSLTRTGTAVGTPYYMSPEQARGMKAHDHRVDLYAAGVILYQCLSGRMPFDAGNYHALLQAILAGKPPPLEGIAPGVSPELSAVVQRAIAVHPGDRFATAQQMLEALVPFGAKLPSDLHRTVPHGTPSLPSDAAPALQTPSPQESAGDVPKPLRLAHQPVAFEAHSADWDESRAPVLRIRTRAPAPDPPSSEPGPPPKTAPEAIRVKGSLLAHAIEHVRQEHGPDTYQRLLADLPADVRTLAEGVILPIAWLPLEHYEGFLREADRLLGPGDGRVAIAIGEATAEVELTNTHGPFLANATPMLAVQRIPQLYRAYHSAGRVEVQPGTSNGWQISMDGLPPEAHLHPLAMSGFYRRLLELTGARDVRASVVSSRRRGAAPAIATLRWR